jgi:PAS domain S-box-containing protein
MTTARINGNGRKHTLRPYELEELAQTLFEEAGDALFLFEPDSEQILDANPMAQRLSGFSRPELLRFTITYLFRSEVQGSLNRLRMAYRKTGVFHSQEGFLLRHQRDRVWVPVNVTVTRLHTESRTLGLVTARDVSECRRAERSLRASEARLQALLESLPFDVWACDADHRFTLQNSTAERHWGNQLGRRLEQLGLPPGLLARWQENNRRALAGELVQGEIQYTRHGQERTYVNIVSPIREGEAVRGVVGVNIDVTERTRAEKALFASEAKYRSLLENLEQCVWQKGLDLRFVAVNEPMCRALGKPEAQILGRDDFDFFPPELAQKYQADDRRVLNEGKRLEVEEQILIAGKVRHIRTVKTPVRDHQGRIVATHGIFWDITEQRSLEAQLRQMQKMEAVGQLAGGVAHDFNNLLTAILGNLSLIATGLPANHPTRELATAAEKAALRAATLTSQLLGFSRQTLLHVQPTVLNGLLDEVVRLLERTFDPRITLEVRPAADLWTVRGDANQLSQVLMNLCLNARDALPDGGRLVLETANVVLDEEHARLHLNSRPGEYVCLRVTDTGCGMTPEVKARIFEPFFTTKGPGKGTGLGLAMVFGIVQQHQGWIDCTSEVGRGTCFEIYLPRSLEAAAPMPTAAGTEPDKGHETVLLVDDEAVLRQIGKTMLERYGYRVLTAADGLEALEVYAREKGRIDLVMLDLTMPRLSGRDTFFKLRELDPDVRVLFASGYSSEQIDDLLRGGSFGFVRKPYRPPELAKLIREALDKAPARG